MRYLLTSIIAVATAAPAFSQTTVPPEPTPSDIIVTASRVTQAAREIGSAVSVVDMTQIEQGQYIFTKDVLQDIPGVRISSDRPGDITSVSIRGSNNDEVLWLIDGIELGDPSQITTAFSPDHLTSQDIARIEVLRGNQSSLYGSDAIGGVINIITQKATEDGYKVSAEAEGGSYRTVSGGASLLGKSGPVDFRITGTGYRHGGPSLADPRTADPAGSLNEDDEYWRYAGSGRVGYQATPELSFQATGFWLKSRSDLDNTTSDSDDTLRTRQWAAAGQASYRSTDGKLKADLTASRFDNSRRYFGTFNSPDGDTYHGIKDELSLALAYDTQGILSFAAGGNYEREKATEITFFSGDFRAKDNTKSGYGEVALRPVEGMTITGAGRYDDNSRFGDFTTYRGTFAYVRGPAKLRASYGTGAKAPGLYQLFDPTYGNPNLKAEKSRGGDVGIDLSLVEGLTAQLTYFWNRKRNEINFDGSLPPFGGYNQFGRTRAKGVEIGVVAKPVAWLALSQSYTYTDHEVDLEDGAGFVDSGRPHYSGTTMVTLTPLARASLAARVRYRAGDESGFGGATQAYTTVDLLGSYGLSERIELYGRVVNLFDKHYQTVYGSNTLGLSAYGGVRVNF